MVSVEGSDTMNQIMSTWAETFMKSNADVPVSLSTHDSGAGISALLNRTSDLAAASRDLTQEETALARTKDIRLKKVTVARDSVAVVVNPQNKVEELTLDQLKDIFTGATNNWNKVGGPDLSISVYVREKQSGTGRFFAEHVLKGAKPAPKAKEVGSNDAVIDAVTRDRGAISFAGIGYALKEGAKVKTVKLKLLPNSPAVAASQGSTTEDYPLSRPLILFMDEQPKDSVKKFVDFCLSDQGQQLVAGAGLVSVK